MPFHERTYGPTHLTLAQCRETERPTIVQSLAAHVAELCAENEKLRAGTTQQQQGEQGASKS